MKCKNAKLKSYNIRERQKSGTTQKARKCKRRRSLIALLTSFTPSSFHSSILRLFPDQVDQRHEDDDGGRQEDLLPMALFVHGGAWSSGERWQYAPLATRLADESVVVGVASYPQFPDAKLVDEMVFDVQAAIKSFVSIAAEDLQIGDKKRFTIIGHSR